MNIYLIVILIIGAFLRFDRLDTLMAFIGDQGWFYLSARNIILNGEIPLVGITSSHVWLHQGPLWTYILAPVLFLFHFNPVGGAYLTAAIGILSMYLIYRIGKDFFSHRFGLIAALFFATSPLVIIHARFAYHTSPIPFFVLLLIYSVMNFIKGRKMFLPVAILSLSILYNLELATVVFLLVLFVVFMFDFYKKEKWVKTVNNRKILISSILLGLIPMIPVLIYDFGHGFPQTIKYAGWFVYKAGQLVGLYRGNSGENLSSVINFFFSRYQILFFMLGLSISVLIFITSVYFIVRDGIRKITSPTGIIFLSTAIPLLGLILSKTSSEAYLPMLFPGLVLSLSYVFVKTAEKSESLKNLAYGAIIVISLFNAQFIYSHNYLIEQKGGFGLSLEKRKQAARKILDYAKGIPYNLRLQGPGSEFESSTMNYEYLVWWLGRNPPSKEKQDLVFIIEEKQKEIDVKIK